MRRNLILYLCSSASCPPLCIDTYACWHMWMRRSETLRVLDSAPTYCGAIRQGLRPLRTPVHVCQCAGIRVHAIDWRDSRRGHALQRRDSGGSRLGAFICGFKSPRPFIFAKSSAPIERIFTYPHAAASSAQSKLCRTIFLQTNDKIDEFCWLEFISSFFSVFIVNREVKWGFTMRQKFIDFVLYNMNRARKNPCSSCPSPSSHLLEKRGGWRCGKTTRP